MVLACLLGSLGSINDINIFNNSSLTIFLMVLYVILDLYFEEGRSNLVTILMMGSILRILFVLKICHNRITLKKTYIRELKKKRGRISNDHLVHYDSRSEFEAFVWSDIKIFSSIVVGKTLNLISFCTDLIWRLWFHIYS